MQQFTFSAFNRSILIVTFLAILVACEKDEPAAMGPTRYLEPAFDSVLVETVVYTDSFGFEMDIYTPLGDANQSRPVVFLGHGGGFYIGSKENPAVIRMGKTLAKLGYVAVAFNYHLASDFSDILDSAKAASLVLKSIGDARAAIRYMRKTADMGNVHGIDPNRFFFGGNSAGGVLAIHVGFFDQNDQMRPFLDSVLNANGGFEGMSGNYGYSSSVQGVFNLAGGIVDLDLIDADDPPIFNAHGLDDNIVPINCGDVYEIFTSGDVIDLCGSIPIHNTVLQVGGSSSLHTYPGEHVPWLDPLTGEPVSPIYDEIEEKVIQFLYDNL